NAQLSAIRAVDMAQPGAENRTHYVGLVSNQGGFMRGCSPTPATANSASPASGPSGAPGGPGPVPNNSAGDPDASFADWYSGHELGHSFGRDHTKACGEPAPFDASFPYPSGQISDDTEKSVAGLDVGDATNGVALAVLWGKTSFDLMTYCSQPDWPSDFTYKAIRQRLLDENPGFKTQRQPRGPAAFVQLIGPLVQVAATVNLTKRTGSFDYVTPLPSAVPTVGVNGRVELVVRDASGREISRQLAALQVMAD